MYAKGKGSTVPSDAQAREKLALYVYEYLLHVGAQKSAQTFLSEIRWEKNITLGEPPGFLHSWWCVFWDLYCAAPERRDTCDHSSEAKAFHDYGFVNSGVNGIAYPFMSPRFPGGPRAPGPVRMPNQVDFNPPGGAAGQMSMPNSMDPRPGHPGIGPMQRMNHPGRMQGPINPVYETIQNYGGIRGPPPNSMGPTAPGAMPPMSMPGGQGNRPWPPTSSSINYSSASPGSYNGPPATGGAPGTPIMPSPQDSTSSGDGMYGMMKASMPNMAGFPPMGGPDGGMPMGADMPAVMNGEMDGMKSSPPNGPGTPREDLPPGSTGEIGGYSLGYQENDQNESAAILKIKESMQEEAKRFEKEADHPEYFMP
ncbi:single-stranded DNA-binding protein 3 isoform X5 [Octopus bimaculoides]|uniref:Single-stranded DNA-binding protein 3 isoform X6 n=1 Tax=Octopus sinensis TaxID=2607531 RepID=A0A7E6F0S9_9MOLL|nr:single-stranded DNA-binding protein 3 isoform X5 [Octopus bimaculoides]XP_036361274.1 single-stranded DNA-binding protein 3 isoform X6 [Octopus sinensis]|eukprot:XP_014777850.1 PREDICTED: single-stranded DNA-binding protein 3-like isoform X5 [Octopus bimaculoides]